ncbi:MAG: ribonuclease HI [Patescibacteria group bacterium]
MITIFTDGSARGNPGPGGWGAIVAKEFEVIEIGGFDPYTTNNKMELTGAIEALKTLEFGVDVTLYTDSEYVMKGMTEWIENWQQKGWRTAAKRPVENQDLWKDLLFASQGKKVEWKYVAGHSGNVANERCDEIATKFADNFSVDLYNGPLGTYPTSLKV